MKKVCLVVFCFMFMFISILNVSATTFVIDSNNNIKMDYNLYSGTDINYEITGLDTHTDFYQIIALSNANTEIISKIDNIADMLKTLDTAEKELKLLTSGTTEYTNQESVVETLKATIDDSVNDSNLKTLISDPTESGWIAIDSSSNVISGSSIVEGNYYVIWLKVVSGTSTFYEYHPYKALASNYYDSNVVTKKTTTKKSTTNPDTGIETTLLYIGVAVTLVVGSYLVINKNKETYD